MKIIPLIASHLDSKDRLNYFIKLIDIIKNQIDYFEKIDLHVSLSYEPIISEKILVTLLSIINQHNFIFTIQEKKMSQFMHYKYLISNCKDMDDNNTWILFSDDDDEWSENRLAIYQHLIENIEDDNTMAVCYTTGNQNEYFGSYVDYCIKLKYVKIFFEYAHDEQLNSKFCDSFFIKFLLTYAYNHKLKIGYCHNDTILYTWIHHDYEKKNDEHNNLEKILKNNLDLYMSQYNNNTIDGWLNFNKIYSDNKIDEINDKIKEYMIKIFNDNYQNHIFNIKNIKN